MLLPFLHQYSQERGHVCEFLFFGLCDLHAISFTLSIFSHTLVQHPESKQMPVYAGTCALKIAESGTKALSLAKITYSYDQGFASWHSIESLPLSLKSCPED